MMRHNLAMCTGFLQQVHCTLQNCTDTALSTRGLLKKQGWLRDEQQRKRANKKQPRKKKTTKSDLLRKEMLNQEEKQQRTINRNQDLPANFELWNISKRVAV